MVGLEYSLCRVGRNTTYKSRGSIDIAECLAEVGDYEFVLLLICSCVIFFRIMLSPEYIAEVALGSIGPELELHLADEKTEREKEIGQASDYYFKW